MMNHLFQTTNLGLQMRGTTDVGQLLICFERKRSIEEVVACFRETATCGSATDDAKQQHARLAGAINRYVLECVGSGYLRHA